MPVTDKQVAYAKALGIQGDFYAMAGWQLSRLIAAEETRRVNAGEPLPTRRDMARSASTPSRPASTSTSMPSRARRGDGYEQWGEHANYMRYQERDRGDDF